MDIGSLGVGRAGTVLIMLVPNDLLDRPGHVPVTRTRLTGTLRELGVRRGGVLMVHVRMSALVWMVGGMDAIVWALLDTIGPDGTLVAFTGWEDSPYHVSSWPTSWQAAYREQQAFDPAVPAARRDFGRLPERLRTWPGAQRSSQRVLALDSGDGMNGMGRMVEAAAHGPYDSAVAFLPPGGKVAGD